MVGYSRWKWLLWCQYHHIRLPPSDLICNLIRSVGNKILLDQTNEDSRKNLKSLYLSLNLVLFKKCLSISFISDCMFTLARLALLASWLWPGHRWVILRGFEGCGWQIFIDCQLLHDFVESCACWFLKLFVGYYRTSILRQKEIFCLGQSDSRFFNFYNFQIEFPS